eukprot:Pgem_evm1s8549
MSEHRRIVGYGQIEELGHAYLDEVWMTLQISKYSLANILESRQNSRKLKNYGLIDNRFTNYKFTIER